MATFGALEPYDSGNESFAQYTERLEQFFIANEIENVERQRAIFLTVVGPTTYGLLKDLLSPILPTARTLAQIIEVLNGHFEPAPSEIVERFKFNSRVRKGGESVSTFIAELRRLAKHCNYGDSLNTMLRDRIVCGIQEEATQRKLLSENGLTLVRATEIAVSMETAAKNAEDLKTPTVEDTNYVHKNKPPERNQRKESPNTARNGHRCNRCGADHKSSDCRFIGATCHACKKIGHIARACRAKSRGFRRDNPRESTEVNQVFERPPEADHEQYDLFNLNCIIGEAPPAVKIACRIEGQKMVFELDSGAPFSLIPLSVYEQHKASLPPLQKSIVKLQSYTKHSIQIEGVVKVLVTFGQKSSYLPLLVVKEGTVSLAGRNWIGPLDLMSAYGDRLHCANAVYPPPTSLSSLLQKHKELFSPELGLLKNVKVRLSPQPSVQPKFYKARSVPYALRQKVDLEIDRLLKDNIIEVVRNSEWATPVVPVVKPDGSIRLCGDFKLTANQATELEQYPLPKIEDLFAQLSNGKTFTKLDLRDAYCQLEVDEDTRRFLVINTQKGLFRYTRLPFGVASAPAIFQREIEKILQGQPGASCYLDDLLVTGKDEETHLKHLDDVLSRLREAGVKLHPSKCEFMKPSVEYLGHRIDKEGLHPITSKLDAIEKAPSPKNVEELRSFIGLLTYYSKFLPNMATFLAPLYKLLEKNRKWEWKEDEERAFQEAKRTIGSSSLLVHFDNNKEVVLACDASPYGLGAVISHKTADGDRPIAFASRSLTKAEKNYSHLEKEALALVFGVTRFRNYLLGRSFTLLTDHRPLLSILSENKPVPPVAAARIQRWALTLSAYAYKIQFRKGSSNGNADACSRLPLQTRGKDPPVPMESVFLLSQLDDTPVTAHMLKVEVERDPVLNQLKSYIQNGWPQQVPASIQPFWKVKDDLSLQNGVIFRSSRVFVPEKFREFILNELHTGHQGISAIKALARSYVWWPSIDSELESKVRSCIPCQENSAAPASKQASWPVPKVAWERIHVDHAGPVDGHMLFIIVDAQSKWLEVFPVSSTSSSAAIAVLRDLFARFGLPKSLVSDNGTAFSSEEFRRFMSRNGITHIRTAPYHPNSNGIAERSVRTTKSALKKITEGPIAQRLARFLFSYRRSPLAATGRSPAENMFGRPMRCSLDLLQETRNSTKKQGPCYTSVYAVGELVWARNFGRGSKWVPGTVLATVGNTMLKVETAAGIWSRHVDQVKHREVVQSAPLQVPNNTTLAAVPSQGVSLPAGPGSPVPLLPAMSPDLQPPTLSPQNDPARPAGQSSTPPVLTPQGPVPAQPQTVSVPPLRRSTRPKQPPRRLNF